MKKLMAIILAVAMVLSFTAVAMADTAKTQDVTISYTVEEAFEWSIPSDLSLNKGDDGKITSSGDIKVENAVLLAGNTVKLSITTLNAKNGKNYLKNGDAEAAYTISVAGTPWVNKTSGLVSTTDGEATMIFGIATDEALNSHLAGNWSDTITFSTEIVKDTSSTDGYCNAPA